MADAQRHFCLVDESSDPLLGRFMVSLVHDPAPVVQALENACSPGASVILILPSLFCAHRRVELSPGLDVDYVKQHLPYHIEDELVEALDAVEIFWAAEQEHVDAFIVSKELYVALENACTAHRLRIDNILCEQQFYLHHCAAPALLCFQDCALGIAQGRILKLPSAMADTLATVMSLPAENRRDLRDTYSRDFIRELMGRPGDTTHWVSLLSNHQKRRNFSRRLSARLEPWLRAIAAALLLTALYQGAAAAYFSHDAKRVNGLSQAIFPEKFGSNRSFSEIETLAKSQLREGKHVAEYEFLSLFQRLAQAWTNAAAEDIKLDAVRFNSTRGLTLIVRFQHFDGFERLSQELKRHGEMELKEMSQQDGFTHATINFL